MAPSSSPRDDLRAAITALVEANGFGHPRLSALTAAFDAYQDARATGAEATLDLRGDLPATPDTLSFFFEIVAAEILRAPSDSWDDNLFRPRAEWRSGLQAMLDATGVDADVSDADEGLRIVEHEGRLAAADIPNVPPTHWWWWLPGDPPA